MLYYALILVSTLVSPLRLTILLPDSVPLGKPVPITLRLTNLGGKPVTAYLQGRPVAFDVIVSRRDGTPVWRRFEGAVVAAVLQVRSLAAGEVLDFSETWPQRTNLGAPVRPGEYFVTGVLPTDPPAELRTRPALLRILP